MSGVDALEPKLSSVTLVSRVVVRVDARGVFDGLGEEVREDMDT